MSTPPPNLPRILLLDHTAALGGGEIALLNLVGALDRQKYDVIVLLFADGPLASKLKEAGVEVILEPLDAAVGDTRKESLGTGGVLNISRLLKSWRFTSRLKRRIRAIGPDLIHTNSLKSDILGGIAGLRAGVPVIWHVRDRIVPEYLPGRVAWIFRRLCRWMPTYIVAISQSVLDTLDLPHRFLQDARRAQVVHDGVLIDDLPLKSEDRNAPISVGIVGRITRWKGQHIFLEAAARVRERIPSARFSIIGAPLFGEAAYEAEIQKLTDDLKLRDAVEFTGHRPDVRELIANLDILVHASTIGEPFGQVVAEGMAAGKPVIATRGGGVPEIIDDGNTGILVPMGDAETLAEAIIWLANKPELREQMGKAARQRAEEYFNIQRTARGVQAVWDRVLSKGV